MIKQNTDINITTKNSPEIFFKNENRKWNKKAPKKIRESGREVVLERRERKEKS